MWLLIRWAWRNIWRQTRRTLITAGAMAVGVGCSIAMIAFFDGMFVQSFDLMVSRNLGHVQIHDPDYPAQKSIYDYIDHGDALVERLDQVAEAKAVSGRVYGYALLATEDERGAPQKAAGAQLVGIVPGREAALTKLDDKVMEGRYLSQAPGKELVLGVDLADTLKASLHDEVVAVTQAADGSMGNDVYEVVGIVRTGSVIQDRSGAFFHIDDLRQLLAMGPVVHEIALLASDQDQIGALAEDTKEVVGERELLVRTWDEINPGLAQMLDMQSIGTGVVLLMVFSVAALGILNTMLMSVFERTRELGVIRAVGLGPLKIVILVMLETLWLVVLAGIAGAALGLALDAYLCLHGLDLSLVLESDAWSFGGMNMPAALKGAFRAGAVFETLIGLTVVSLLAAIWPAVRAARLRPVEAMRQE